MHFPGPAALWNLSPRLRQPVSVCLLDLPERNVATVRNANVAPEGKMFSAMATDIRTPCGIHTAALPEEVVQPYRRFIHCAITAITRGPSIPVALWRVYVDVVGAWRSSSLAQLVSADCKRIQVTWRSSKKLWRRLRPQIAVLGNRDVCKAVLGVHQLQCSKGLRFFTAHAIERISCAASIEDLSDSQEIQIWESDQGNPGICLRGSRTRLGPRQKRVLSMYLCWHTFSEARCSSAFRSLDACLSRMACSIRRGASEP